MDIVGNGLLGEIIYWKTAIPLTKQTTGIDLHVAEPSLAELRQMNAGTWKDSRLKGERIPRLE